MILIIIAVFNFLMATVILLKNRRSIINLSFAMVVAFAGLWIIGIAIFSSTLNMEAAVAWARLYYFAAAVIPLAFVVFANYYPYPLKIINEVGFLYLLFPFLVVVFIIFHPTLFLETATHYDWGNDANVKQLGHLTYTFYFCSYVIWAYVILFKKLKNSEGINKKNLSLVMAGTMLSYAFGITFDLILPLLGNYKLIWIGPYFTVITLLFLAYIIFYKSIKIRIN